jgi:outer membrane protein OmpA-like peptidoglycan-associated protein
MLPLLAAVVASSSVPAFSQDASRDPSFQVAQKNEADDDADNDKKKGKRPPGKEDRNGGGKSDFRNKGKKEGPPNKSAGPNGSDNPDKNSGAPKNNALQKKQEADQARQNAVKQKQLQIQQAKEKALQKKLEAGQARQNAGKQKQLEIQQAKEKALQKKLEADQARQNAGKQKQLEIQQAKEKALQKKLEADQARQNAGKQKSNRGPSKFDRAKVDMEFERARLEAQGKHDNGGGKSRFGDNKEKWRDGSDKKFEALRRGRKERDVGSRNLIIEPDKRVIVRQNDRAFIRHDESSRLQRTGREVRRERRKDGTLMIVTMGLAGALIYSLQDDDGRVLRRSRKGRDGREAVLFDNRHYYRGHGGSQFGPDQYYDSYIDLPPPVVRIPRDKYIVEYDSASPEDLYDALNAPPIEPLERGYSLDEVRSSYPVLERMRRVDLDTINFEFGSWDVEPDQFGKLERIANAIRRIVERSPEEVFLIEGHTDAVGSDIDNLSLSDRRAESVAVILSETFGIPPENLTTQGYGEQYLKVPTEDPSRINRRVSMRRITPLLSREGWDEDWDQSSR